MDLHEVGSFFEARVIGQGEATEAMVDLITLVKAGLTDPYKPMGVFLFVGPTGVGKTDWPGPWPSSSSAIRTG